MNVIQRILRMTPSIDHDVIFAVVKSDKPEVLLLVLEHCKRHSGNIMTHGDLGDLHIHAIRHDAISHPDVALRTLHGVL